MNTYDRDASFADLDNLLTILDKTGKRPLWRCSLSVPLLLLLLLCTEADEDMGDVVSLSVDVTNAENTVSKAKNIVEREKKQQYS